MKSNKKILIAIPFFILIILAVSFLTPAIIDKNKESNEKIGEKVTLEYFKVEGDNENEFLLSTLKEDGTLYYHYVTNDNGENKVKKIPSHEGKIFILSNPDETPFVMKTKETYEIHVPNGFVMTNYAIASSD